MERGTGLGEVFFLPTERLSCEGRQGWGERRDRPRRKPPQQEAPHRRGVYLRVIALLLHRAAATMSLCSGGA